MAILSKGCNPDNFEPYNSLKLYESSMPSFQFFVECELFLESNSPDFLALCETNLDDSNGSGNFSVTGLSSFKPKRSCYSYAWSFSLCERRASFCTGFISRKVCRFLLMFSTSFTSFSSIDHLLCRYARFLIQFHLT